MGEGCFYYFVVPIGGGHVGEGWGWWGLERPAFAEDDHLDYLGAGCGVEGAKGVVGVAGDDAAADEPIYCAVEELVGVDIGEGYAWERCGSVGRAWGIGGWDRGPGARGSDSASVGWFGGVGRRGGLC